MGRACGTIPSSKQNSALHLILASQSHKTELIRITNISHELSESNEKVDPFQWDIFYWVFFTEGN
jgi:hypothetical protein